MIKHGVYVSENPTSVTVPMRSDSAVQVVVGTAPVNLVESPSVNTPVLALSLADAVSALGYSTDFKNFTLCQSMDMSFNQYAVAPVIFINVLDPKVHNVAGTEGPFVAINNTYTIEQNGILLDSNFILEEDSTTLILDMDYAVAFDSNGYVVVTILNPTYSAASLTATFKKIDPSKVTSDDVIGGINPVTGTRKGFEVIKNIYPKFNIVSTILLAPGWTHDPAVALALEAKAKSINSVFSAVAVVDLDASIPLADVGERKAKDGYVSADSIACYPKAVLGDRVYYYSAVVAAGMAWTDAINGSLPYVSPSNHTAKITGLVDADGNELDFDIEDANLLNSFGVVTALNMSGWKIWGNYTSIYPSSTDPKDCFIPVKRMFKYVANSFISTYFQKVDDPMNTRLIESVVDSENIRLNGFVAAGALLGGKITFPQSLNPVTDLLAGTIRFHTLITPPLVAQDIENIIEFDVNALDSLF